jgi:hypothetical protein
VVSPSEHREPDACVAREAGTGLSAADAPRGARTSTRIGRSDRAGRLSARHAHTAVPSNLSRYGPAGLKSPGRRRPR